MKRFEKTFREKINSSYHKIVGKCPFMRIPAFLALGFVLILHYFWSAFIGAWKKYAFTSFLLINILIGSSFAYPVFGDRDGFISSQASYEAMPVAESTIKLMSDDEIFYPDFEEEDLEDNINDLDEYDSYSLEEILAGRETVDNLTLPGAEDENTDTDLHENIEFYADDWRLILINKQHPIPDDYAYVLGTIKGSMQCDARIIDELLTMMQKAYDEGIELEIISPYRDLAHQELLFNRKIDSYIRSGLSYFEAYRRAAHTVTVPGTSEHQVGLAIDITSRDYRNLNIGFAETKAGRWLAENSHEFGFIVRYPLGKEYITGIQFEPWHFRYVGKEAARIIKEEQLTLEEFLEKYVAMNK
ncbi:MAG: M15 family metallopeptidase [Lachnospiraceae bacterium]|nr:M15 family metallopeptidase [Lachnospiraceae bacterium]